MQNIAPAIATPHGLSQSSEPAVFTDLHKAEVNLCVWSRELANDITRYSDYLLSQYPYATEIRVLGDMKILAETLRNSLPMHNQREAFIDDICVLADMLICLLDAKAVGLRLCVTRTASCPRFHVDKLGCRLITTYRGKATEWLDNINLDRTKLGRGALGKDDSKTGLYLNSQAVQKLDRGDVALLKGELWPGNEGRGIIHRSPKLGENERRLFITMDAIT
ncbi:DUF1826 domain-containing protein [Gilvimarinus agarilyticus]|uniref:DUF1826 domain-containing protein n=1 Tax=Gilvimarinus agarilyticus TaxID=679259 RepID=UPI000698C34C|nr:DUF1826 domain-containing protein [Gilvimarinus agarilyticus]